MSIADNLQKIKSELPAHVTFVAVSKTHPPELILEAYHAGQRIFGENKVQELVAKQEVLPKDIEWHLIGHLQTNKVRYIASFVNLIHSVDSVKLLKEINKEALKNSRIISCLLQIHIAKEETKFGLGFDEAEALLNSPELASLKNVKIIGLMGMATLTNDEALISSEFHLLFLFFKKLTIQYSSFTILSMGMSSDYPIAIREGSTMVRVGTAVFGHR